MGCRQREPERDPHLFVQLYWGNVHTVMADVRNVCVFVKSAQFPCRRDVLGVNKKGRMERKGAGVGGGDFVNTTVIF